MRTLTRPFRRTWSETHPLVTVSDEHPVRPGNGMAPLMAPWFRPQEAGSGLVFAGMDPSDPSTYVRTWNPQPGMVGRLNFDGAQVQGETEMGAVWGLPAWRDRLASTRPARRPR